MGTNDLRVGLNLTPVRAQRLSFRIEWGLEIKGMGRWTVIVQVLQAFGALCSGGGLVIRYPPGYEGGPVTFDEPVVAFAQYLGMEPIVGEGVNRLHIFPKRKGCRGIAVLPAGKESGTDVASAPIPLTGSVVSFPTITGPVYEPLRVLGAGINKGVPVMESLDLFVVTRLLKDAKCI
jgi:hypothetical protein